MNGNAIQFYVKKVEKSIPKIKFTFSRIMAMLRIIPYTDNNTIQHLHRALILRSQRFPELVDGVII